MTRKPEYQQFLDAQVPGSDTAPRDEESIARTKEEMGWWKKQHVTEAIRLARKGKASREQLYYLATRRGLYYPTTPKRWIKKLSAKQLKENRFRK